MTPPSTSRSLLLEGGGCPSQDKKRTFVCASSCIKQYVQPSYGCRGMPVVAGMCLNCVKKLFNTKNVIKKKNWNKNEKHF